MRHNKLNFYFIFVLSVLFLACNDADNNKNAENTAYFNPAIISYTQAIENDPTDASLYFKRSIALSNLNQDDLALQDLDKAISLDPQNDTYLTGKGELLFVLGKYSESILAYKKALDINPNKIQINLAIAKCLLMDGQLDQAKSIVEKLRKDNPYYPDAFYVQSQLAAAEKDTTSAILLLDKALKLDPYYYEASLLMAEYLAEIKNKNAIKQYIYTYSLDSTDVFPMFQIGYYYEQLKDTPNAINAYRTVVMLDKDYTDAHIQLGKIWMAQDSIEKSKRSFYLAVITEPQNSQAHYLLGKAYETLKIADSAKLHYGNAVNLDPKNNLAKEALQKMKQVK